MPTPEPRTRIDETDAKAGSREGVVRWVLLLSLAGAIVALTLIWVTGALTQDAGESQMNVERKPDAGGDAATSEDSSTDGISAPETPR
ncbi:hypothetical protein [Erythrobacter oryzae]|uniref:hypothetical protein n=1 Tax=Erythrobacter oryzae TaxID=3019556 RepID=UPI0025546958|nr:hypothetical protein [Erythrobacter sp. COR-2]